MLSARLGGVPVASHSQADGLSASAADLVEVEHIPLSPLPRSAITDIARDRLGHKASDDVGAVTPNAMHADPRLRKGERPQPPGQHPLPRWSRDVPGK